MKTRKQFIRSQLIFPLCYTVGCLLAALSGYLTGSDMAVAIFGTFAVLSYAIWHSHIEYALSIKNYRDYVLEQKSKLEMDEKYQQDINKILEENKPRNPKTT